jgi:HD-like signal output (HDOD) protein
MLVTPQIDAGSRQLESDTLRSLCNLPRLHPSATRLLSVTGDDEIALKTFEQVFASDPSLTADLLRAANSVEFGLRAKVTSVSFALMVLGMDRTRSLAVTIALSKYGRGVAGGKVGRSIWLHSLATAVVSEEMGACLGVNPAHQYTVGLMHDLGRLGLLTMAGQRYAELLAKEFLNLEEAHAVETALFGTSHARAGAFLAETWRFPKILCDCIRAHHDVPAQDDHEELRVTQRACAVAWQLGFPELPYCPFPQTGAAPFVIKLQNRPELDPERLTALIRQRIELF